MPAFHPHIVSDNTSKTLANKNNQAGPVSENVDANKSAQGELEKLLSAKVKNGQKLEDAVRNAIEPTNNELLFSFPADRFPISCRDVVCISLRDNPKNNAEFLYLYQAKNSKKIKIADRSSLDDGFLDFAKSFSSVMEQIRDIVPDNIH